MAGARGYHSYRGRTPKSRIVLAVILVVIILAAVLFMVFQQFVVYDETGHAWLDLPWQTEEPSQEEEPPDNVEITVEEPERTETKTLQLDAAPLTDWDSAAAQAAAAGCNSVAVTVKDASGQVYFYSAQPAASGAIRTESTTAAALTAMTASDTYTIARLSCLLDPIAAKADVEGMGLKNTGGYIFYDGNNLNWLDPSKPAARQYLCGFAKELAEMGFDEILLTDVSYPTEGKLDKIAYGETGKVQNLNTFLDEMRAALAAYDVKLSIELPAAAVSEGSDSQAGLTLADIAPRVDRIYAVTTEDQISALSQAVSAASAETEFVPELAAAPAAFTGSWLVTG